MANNLGALPTPFALNAACRTEMERIYCVYDNSPGWFLQGPPLHLVRCLPGNYGPATTYYYFPAPECPSGYTSACQSLASVATLTDTYITCCPT